MLGSTDSRESGAQVNRAESDISRSSVPGEVSQQQGYHAQTPGRFGPQNEFVLPDYDGYCLSNIPRVIQALLEGRGRDAGKLGSLFESRTGLENVRNIVLVLADGLGYGLWEEHANDPGFFAAVTKAGFAHPITTVFPSTTCAALTTLATGLTPQEHGLAEWFLYLREVDAVIESLPFRRMGSEKVDELCAEVDSRVLFSGRPVFESLSEKGVDCYSLLGRGIATTAYTRLSLSGSKITGYDSPQEMFQTVTKIVNRARSPTLVYAYLPNVDSAEHRYGPRSAEVALEAASLSAGLGESLKGLESVVADSTLVILTADHGHVQTKPEEMRYLNRYPALVSAFERGPSGRQILPAGSPRDVMLHIKEEDYCDAKAILESELGSQGVVLSTDDALGLGLYGRGSPTQAFKERVGNLLLLMRDSEGAWFEFEGVPPLDLVGMHGGATEDEIMIPLAVAKASSLKK